MVYLPVHRRAIVLRAVLVLLLLPVVALGADFGVADWGMHPDQVRALDEAEPVPPVANGILWYQTEFSGLSAHRAYHFEAGKLARGTIRLKARPKANRRDAVRDFEAVERRLSARNGDPEQPFTGNVARHLSTWHTPHGTVNHRILKRAERYMHSVWMTPH